ncbi:MAG: cysteine desulfurase [Lachnospiraceae bacterium]|nr:cysteine desulfurase [Lachnospiraceae bacterium]
MEIYLDNAATTRTDPAVADLMVQIMTRDYGNAASLHRKGVEAERFSLKAREQIARTLKCEPKNIYFTSGGTESNNWAIINAAGSYVRSGKHLITTLVEHASVKNVMEALKEQGFEITYLPVDEYGRVSVEEVRKAVRPDTILVSVMAVNNEIGTREPVEEIGAMLSREFPQVLFHVDAIQAYGKYRMNPKRDHIDLLSVSAHKIHGPKGAGFLYVSDRVKLRPLIYGGGQQKGMRSGTENIPGEAGLGLAAELAYRNLDEKNEGMYRLKDRLREALEKTEGTRINGCTAREDSAPHILSCSFDKIRSEVLLHALEDRGIYVSSGSACSSSHPSLINTLSGIGLPPEMQDGTIRFSLSKDTTEEEIDETVKAVQEVLPYLRRFIRK